MASAKTEFLGLTVFPDIAGVYQREIRIALITGANGNDSNMHLIDAAVKGLSEALDKLAKVATSGSYSDLKDTPDIPNAVPIATTAVLGKVKPDGITILIDENGTIRATCEIATTDKTGIVKPDGTTISVDEDGTIHMMGDFYSKSEVDDMMQQLSELLLPSDELTLMYDATETLLGDGEDITGLGATLLQVNALADELLS